MSNVTSQSELTTKEIVEQAISDYHMSIFPYLAKGNNGYSETPIGAMQMFDDDTAPSGWLVADGTVYNIDDYPFLANHYERVHGSKNHYGGDGTTTFAVPDWQGEFFRASGPNSHMNTYLGELEGSGASIGEHQSATVDLFFDKINNSSGAMYNGGIARKMTSNMDAEHRTTGYTYFANGETGSLSSGNELYTSRPTNTSLLCCVKAVPAGINYSLEEQEIGTWIDGRSLYQKVIPFTTGTDNSSILVQHNISNIGEVISCWGAYLHGTEYFPLGFDFEADSYASGRNYSVRVSSISSTNLKVVFGTNRRSKTGYAIVRYTKTTD